MMLHLSTLRKMSPSRPLIATAAAPIARFCGEIIFPNTPPEELAAAISVGLRPAFFAAVTCRAPNSELDDVSEPVTATPNQPMIGDRKANALPAPASHSPRVIVSPEKFMTNASESTDATVRIAHRSSYTVSSQARSAREGRSLIAGIVRSPE